MRMAKYGFALYDVVVFLKYFQIDFFPEWFDKHNGWVFFRQISTLVLQMMQNLS